MTDGTDEKRRTAASFGSASASYLNSEVHREGADLEQLAAWCEGRDVVLDIATGAGHTAGAVRGRGSSFVIASDTSPDMVTTAVENFDGVFGVVADAEQLPFKSTSMDAVTCRIAAHHFPDPEAFVAEVARVLKPGGLFALEDNVSPPDETLATFLNEVEGMRDTTHIESYATDTWREWLTAAGLVVEDVHHLKKTIGYDFWTNAQSLSPEQRSQLDERFEAAPPEAVKFFEIEMADETVQSFANLKALIRATKQS